MELAYFRHVYSGFEPSQAFDVITGGSFEHRLLSSQRATMEHQRLGLGAMRLETGNYDFPVVALGSMPRDAICIGFVAEGIETARYNTVPFALDEIQVYPAGAELLYHAAGPSRWVTLTIGLETLQRAALARVGRPLKLAQRFAQSVQVARGDRQRLTCLTDDAMAVARRLEPLGGMSRALADEVQASLLLGYVDALAVQTAPSANWAQSTAGRHHHLITACERLVLSGDETDIALREVARRSGYSQRSLELIFRRGVGMTPGRWFLTARLNRALRDLLSGDEACTVASVAMKWGFRHMSRFAGAYRAAFGESPSETLRHARERCRGNGATAFSQFG
ncbi:helix-turn-helix domain-containing protein [Achromobacter sp. NFACC18-2]|uniref:helix-turn-helix domain-containing protein n=1 Tax=Achromobacter sp. NFACC18-2 TaxID=1564112 RepID=UPI0008D147A4|nr:helix-turn-helix domain-containing protein [Achromobacter sp. NFACC18-2]SEJ27006.1 transcriptional regulator, AraC family [Achromobacter sp. NFACC18-2]